MRHTDTVNPGTFTILMNQDYWGLRANVGVRVNGGSWTEYPMNYAGRKDNNSKWTFTPSIPFPAGASVTYYFKGYDGSGQTIWDSRNGQNYSFTAPSLISNVTWGATYDIPHGPGVAGVDIAAYNGNTYAVWAEGVLADHRPGAPFTLKFARKPSEGHWSTPVVLSTNGSYPKIAVAGSGVHVIYSEGMLARYVRSANEGASWSAPIDLVGTSSDNLFFYARLRADADYCHVIYNEYRIPETSSFHYRRIHRNATTWEPARPIHVVSSYKTTGYVIDFHVRGNTIMLTSLIAGWYGSGASYYHESLDGGLTWREATPPESAGATDMQMSVKDNGVVTLAYSGNSSAGRGVYVSLRQPGAGYWSTAPAPTFYGDRTVSAMQPIGQRDVLVLTSSSPSGGLSRDYAILQDEQVVSDLAPAGVIPPWTVQDAADDKRISLLLNDSGMNGYLPMYSVLTSVADGTPATSLSWLGNIYSWPAQPTSSQMLWINAETWPAGSARSTWLVYAVAEGDPSTWTWKALPMTIARKSGNNDSWHVSLGYLPAGTRIQYAIKTVDATGKVTWNKNGDKDFTAAVN